MPTVELLGLFRGHLAAQQFIGVLESDEQACRDPHLEVTVEGVVLHRTVRARLHLPVRLLTASRNAARSSSDPTIATARYWNVVRARFHGCFIRLPDSTLLSTTPWPTPGPTTA